MILPEVKKEGAIFKGWYSDAAFTNKITEANVTSIDNNIDVYAKWSEAVAQLYNQTISGYFETFNKSKLGNFSERIGEDGALLLDSLEVCTGNIYE